MVVGWSCHPSDTNPKVRLNMELAVRVIGLTATALFLYYFIFKADEASKVIKSLSSAYVDSVKTLQGR